MERMPYPASVPAEVQALLDARPPRNVFRMMAHAPALMPGIMELTGAVLYRAKLEAGGGPAQQDVQKIFGAQANASART
jgi:hypothetical protein